MNLNFFIIIIFTIIYILYYVNLNNSCSYIFIDFYDSYELSEILKLDLDNYYKNMNYNNLKLRNITDKTKYLNNIKSKLYDLNEYEKSIISKSIYIAENKLKNIKKQFAGFDYTLMKNINWNIGCAKLNFELSYPHTRNDIIILNVKNIFDKELYKTLIHERIHIYQKLYPDKCDEYIKLNNFKLVNLDRYNKNNLLHNPDTNNLVYEKNNIIYKCEIKNENKK